jgi:CDP-diacylglycerol--glycerol-3-phosphate 3-phosphatidyltransferase
MHAHALTALRLLSIPFFVACLREPGRAAAIGAALLFALAIATDVLDGRVARRRATESPAGRAFDHATDFLFVVSGLAVLALRGRVPLALPLLVAVAFAQYAIDSYWLHRARQLRMSALGRWNGVLYFVPLGAALAGIPALEGPIRWTAWALCASTLASILDRALALRLPLAGAPGSRAAGTGARSPR